MGRISLTGAGVLRSYVNPRQSRHYTGLGGVGARGLGGVGARACRALTGFKWEA